MVFLKKFYILKICKKNSFFKRKKIWLLTFFQVNMKLFDAHTHLNHEMLFPEWKSHLKNFIEQWWSALVNIWANQSYNSNALIISQEAKQISPDLRCKASIGIHPCDVGDHLNSVESEIQKLRSQYQANKQHIIAIGECGIDLYYPGASDFYELQKSFFTAQCELARELNLPIIIHSRFAFAETVEVLQHFRDLKIYFHCRSYTEQEIQALNELFPKLWIGFTGILTYPKSESIRASLLICKRDQILIETDAPYLSPQGLRGQTNTPQRVKEIWLFAADLLGISEERLWQEIEKNFWNFYQ